MILPIVFVIAIFVGGIVSLDKVIIPKSFGSYNINNIGDMASVISALYGVKKETKNSKQAYDDGDRTLAISKLQEAGYKIESDGKISQDNKLDFNGTETLILTDRELSSVLTSVLASDVLMIENSTLEFIGCENIEFLETSIDFNDFLSSIIFESNDIESFATMNIRFKIDTEKLRKQIALNMETTEALLNLILPSKLYFCLNVNIDFESEDCFKINEFTVNGHGGEKSERLMNLLIDFIFPKSEEMTSEKFAKSFCEIITSEIKTLGRFKFIKNIDETNKNGIILNYN